MHEEGRVDYRKVAQVGVTAALCDAVDRHRRPEAPAAQHDAGLRWTEARGDPVAVRVFRYAYLRASENPDPWAYYRV